MARVGGRSWWIAGPATVLCLAIVVALGMLAAPGLPGAVSFVGDMLRAATSVPAAAGDPPRWEASTPADDCRTLYSQPLWSALVWSPDALLSQNRSAPVSTPEAVAAASPTVVVTCRWRGAAGRSISTTVSTVTGAGASAVQATLSSQGFACSVAGSTTHCERTTGDVREVHDLRGDRWVSSTLTGWAPEGYTTTVASRAFGG